MFLFGLTSIEAWIILLVSSLVPTVMIYFFTGRTIERNFASLKGTLQGFSIELGGPVAFYAVLLLLGRNYIPPYVEIELKGSVRNLDGEQLKDYQIARLNFHSSDAKGNFAIKTVRGDEYDFVVARNGVLWRRAGITVSDTKAIVLNGFPDERVTKVEGENLIDQRGRSLHGYTVEIEQSVRPKPASIEEGRRVEVDIEHGAYMAIFRDSQGRERAVEHLRDVGAGSRYPLPKVINVKE